MENFLAELPKESLTERFNAISRSRKEDAGVDMIEEVHCAFACVWSCELPVEQVHVGNFIMDVDTDSDKEDGGNGGEVVVVTVCYCMC